MNLCFLWQISCGSQIFYQYSIILFGLQAPCCPHSAAGLAASEAGHGLPQLLLVSPGLLQEVRQPAPGGGQAARCGALQVSLISFLGEDVLALPAPDLALQGALASVSLLLGQVSSWPLYGNFGRLYSSSVSWVYAGLLTPGQNGCQL